MKGTDDRLLVVERDHQRQQPGGGLSGLYIHRRHPASTHDGASSTARAGGPIATTSILSVSGAEHRTFHRWVSTPGAAGIPYTRKSAVTARGGISRPSTFTARTCH